MEMYIKKISESRCIDNHFIIESLTSESELNREVPRLLPYTVGKEQRFWPVYIRYTDVIG